MRNNYAILILFFLSLQFFFSNTIYSKPAYKEVTILGLRVFEKNAIIKRFKLQRLKKNRKHFRILTWRINRYYHRKGYLLARTYLVEETADTLKFYIDEGRLGKVIYLGLGSVDTLKIKYDFSLKKRTYNKLIIDSEVRRLKKKYNFKDVHVEIIPVKNYDESLFQLDREFNFPFVGPSQLPFFDKYGHRYDLEIHFLKKSGASEGFSYGFKTSYSKGLIPRAQYVFPNLFAVNDKLLIGSSFGIFYGLDLNFKEKPYWTFVEAHTRYHFPPTLKDIFTPRIKASGYRSRSSRQDIGLSKYEYLKLDGTLSPGITLLRQLKLFFGYGGEKVFIYESEANPDATYIANVEEHVDYWNYFEFETAVNFKLWTLKRTIQRRVNVIYKIYLNGETFNELFLRGKFDYEFKNFDVYDFAFEYARVWDSPPFYHEVSVDNSCFKGFMGKSFHSRHLLRVGNEYRFSVYRDYIFTGLFCDGVWFKGSGYDLYGDQYGIVAGIAGHIIYLDQFEFNIYFGRDYLFSTEESQNNIYLKFRKKW